MTTRVVVGVVTGLVVAAMVIGTVAVISESALAASPARPAAGIGGGNARAGPLGVTDGRVRAANATVVGQGENVTVVRRAQFDVVEATDRNYTEIRGDPVVADGRLYIVVAGNKVVGNAGKQRHFTALYALNATTLEPDWRVEFPEAETHGNPVVADGTVYLVEMGQTNGSAPNPYVLHAFDAATGAQHWHRDIGSVRYADHLKASGTHNDQHPIYRVADHVVTLTVASGPQALVGLDPATGQIDWRYEGVVAGVETDGQRLYAGYRQGTDPKSGGVVALDPATGSQLWTHANGNSYGQLRVDAAANGRVYATRPAPRNTSAVATLHALDSATGTEDYWVAAPHNTRLSSVGVYPSAATVMAVSWSPKNGTAQPRSLVAVNDSAGRVQWAVDWNRLGQGWRTYTGDRNFYIFSEGSVSATHASDLDGSSSGGWFPQAAWSQDFDDFSSIRDLQESGGDLYVLRSTTTGSAVSVYDGDSGELRYEFDFDAIDAGFSIQNETIYAQAAGVLVSYTTRPKSDRQTDTDSDGGGQARPGGSSESTSAQTRSPADTSGGSAIPPMLSDRGPLGVPIIVYVGLALVLVTSSIIVGRRYGSGKDR
ncbi:MAG: PQQ-binding-like beta-propeller repeat protein [Halorientalis sp.]